MIFLFLPTLNCKIANILKNKGKILPSVAAGKNIFNRRLGCRVDPKEK